MGSGLADSPARKMDLRAAAAQRSKPVSKVAAVVVVAAWLVGVLSTQCELVSTWQSSAHDQQLSGGKHLPLR